jgi:hypothetical protein
MSKCERKQSPVDTTASGDESPIYLPSGVRTPIQESRTCW